MNDSINLFIIADGRSRPPCPPLPTHPLQFPPPLPNPSHPALLSLKAAEAAIFPPAFPVIPTAPGPDTAEAVPTAPAGATPPHTPSLSQIPLAPPPLPLTAVEPRTPANAAATATDAPAFPAATAAPATLTAEATAPAAATPPPATALLPPQTAASVAATPSPTTLGTMPLNTTQLVFVHTQSPVFTESVATAKTSAAATTPPLTASHAAPHSSPPTLSTAATAAAHDASLLDTTTPTHLTPATVAMAADGTPPIALPSAGQPCDGRGWCPRYACCQHCRRRRSPSHRLPRSPPPFPHSLTRQRRAALQGSAHLLPEHTVGLTCHAMHNHVTPAAPPAFFPGNAAGAT